MVDKFADYISRSCSFVPYLTPEDALHIPVPEILGILRQRWGKRVDLALSPRFTNPDSLLEVLPEEIRSPVAAQPDGNWLRHANLVGEGFGG